MLAVATIVLGYSAAAVGGSPESRAIVNASLPVAMALSCLGCAAALVRRSKLLLLTPIPWFLLTSAAYFGLGPLLFVFGHPETIEAANAFYPVTEESLFRTNALNAICILTVVAAYWVAGRLALLRTVARTMRVARLPERRWLMVFLVVGVVVRFTLSLPYNYGVLLFVPPTSLMVFGNLASVALLMLSRRVFLGQWRLLPLFAGLAGLSLAGGVLQFSKLEALLVLIFIGVGAYLARPTLRLAVGFSLVAVVAYVLLIPLVQYGRQVVGPDASASDRGQATVGYARHWSAEPEEQNDSTQYWLARLSYVPVQAFVMDAYERGAGGTSMLGIPASLIPRFLWPNKPIVTIGAELTFLINGSSSSQSSPTSFGEGYWNGGWLLALVVAAWMGLIFRFFEAVCLRPFAGGNYGVLPFASLGMLMGLRPDDWFGPTYVGGFAITLVVHVSCQALAAALRNKRSAPGSSGG